jgi:CheY-like chemotaxis protein
LEQPVGSSIDGEGIRLHTEGRWMQTILYIEGHADGAEVGKALLATNSRTMIFADTGEDGLSLAREHEPDLILLDLSPPDLGGLAVLDRLKEDVATRAIPVIVISARSIEEMPGRQRALIAAYASRPIDLTELPLLVDRVLPQPESRSWRCTVCASEWLRPVADTSDRIARCIRCNGALTSVKAHA